MSLEESGKNMWRRVEIMRYGIECCGGEVVSHQAYDLTSKGSKEKVLLIIRDPLYPHTTYTHIMPSMF